MAKASRSLTAKNYKSVGTTFDGVRILAPKKKATSFTTREIRAAIADVLAERGDAGSRVSPPTKPKRARAKSSAAK